MDDPIATIKHIIDTHERDFTHAYALMETANKTFKTNITQFYKSLAPALTALTPPKKRLPVTPKNPASASVWEDTTAYLGFEVATRRMLTDYVATYPLAQEPGRILGRTNENIVYNKSQDCYQVEARTIAKGNATSLLIAIAVRYVLKNNSYPMTAPEILKELKKIGFMLGDKKNELAVLHTVLKQRKIKTDVMDELTAPAFNRDDATDNIVTFWPNDLGLPTK